MVLGPRMSLAAAEPVADVAADARTAAQPLKVICFLFDPNTGGPTIRARAVYQRMVAMGYEVRIAFPDGEGTAGPYIAEAGLPVDRLPILKPVHPKKLFAFLTFALSVPVALWRLVRYLRRHRPDVIHVNGAFDVAPALAGRLAGVPVVWHLNDTVFGPGLSLRLGWLVKRVATVVVTAADRVGQHYGVADRAMTIHAPVDTDRNAARAPGWTPGAAAKVGLLANWNWIKGHDRFVDLIALLRDRGRSVQGVVMGAFHERQRAFWEPIVDRMKRDGLDQHVDARGFVADTAAGLAELDILVLTSQSEASPMCVHEGMSIGVPQVVFDVGGVREMLGEGDGAAGIIVPPGDVEAMADGVARLLDDPDLYARMAANGQARARAHFSLDACVARHQEAYGRAVGRPLEESA